LEFEPLDVSGEYLLQTLHDNVWKVQFILDSLSYFQYFDINLLLFCHINVFKRVKCKNHIHFLFSWPDELSQNELCQKQNNFKKHLVFFA